VGTALAGKAWQGRWRRPVREDHDRRHHAGGPRHRGAAGVHEDAADGRVEIPAGLLQAGDNRRCKGEDLMRGPAGLARRRTPRPAACGLVASLGIARSKCSGAEGRLFLHRRRDPEPGRAPREGAVYDSNRYTVHGLLQRLGCEVIDLGVVRDEPACWKRRSATRRRAPTRSSPAAA
jgi:molybdopterin molybdotransferase